MRLIDVDALKEQWRMGNKCEECERNARDCNYYDFISRMDVCSMLDDAPTVDLPDALRAAGWKEEGWVSVKERMPDKPCGCLVFNIYGWRALDFWEGDGWAISDENEITHWMSLPESPKGESHETN